MDVKLHVDLETLQLILGPGQRSAVTSLRFKRGDAARLQVVFLENGVSPATIGDPGLLQIQFGIKPRNQFNRSYLAHGSEWTMPSEGDDAPAYEGSISFNTLQLDSALNIGSATAEELPEITLMGEITWREGAGEPTSTRTFLVVVENDVNRGTEGIPTSAEPAYPAASRVITIDNIGQYATPDSPSDDPPVFIEHTADAYEWAWSRRDGENAIAPGQVFVVTGEGGRVMRWAGDVSAGASVSVTADFSGLHVVHPGFPAHFTRSGDFYHDGPVYEDVLGSGCKVVRLPANTADFGLASVNIARWVLVGSSGNSGATAPAAGTTPPWSVAWSSGSVARNSFAAPANWEIQRETYQAFVFPYGYYRINGIDCYSYSVFFIGWLAEGGAPSVRDYGNGNPIPYDLARFTRFSVKPPSGYYGLTESEPISDGETFFRTIKAPAGRVIYLEMS